MKRISEFQPAGRLDVHFVTGALLAVGVLVLFVACVHAY